MKWNSWRFKLKIKKVLLLVLLILIIIMSSCSNSSNTSSGNEDNRRTILKSDYTNDKRNELLVEDIEYFRKQLTKNHKNPFHNITKKEFNKNVDNLISKVGELTNEQVFVEINKIVASLGDAHTGMNYWDGYSYPLKFYFFNDGIYVIDADKSLEDILHTKIKKINNVDINVVTEQLKTLISHENEFWVKERLPDYLSAPVFMYGLGIISNKDKTVFEFEKVDGEVIKKEINILEYGEKADYINSDNITDFQNEDYYWYEYLENDKVLYFKYNVCANMDEISFNKFNDNMFSEIKNYNIKKFVIDLRHNSGGNSSVINPFLESISKLVSTNPEMKVYIVTGRRTFSSGVMAVLDIKNSVSANVIGESTGGSPNCYGEVKVFELPNSRLPINYSIKYFKLTNDGANTITPDVIIEPEIQDYINNRDNIMEYIKAEN